MWNRKIRDCYFSLLVLSAALAGCAALEKPTVARPPPESTITPVTTPTTAQAANPAFIAERAQQALATGRWDVAEGYYLQLLRLTPNDAALWFQLGNLYAEQGRLDSAQRAYHESLRRRDDARTLHNLGLVQVRLGIGALREAQKRLPPDDPARQETREFLQTVLEAAMP